MRLVAAVPELVHLRVGYEAAGWAERLLDHADPDHPQFVAAVGAAARGAWNRGDFDLARALATRAAGRVPPPGTARIAYPGDVLADVALYEGDVDVALRHYVAEAQRARDDGDRIRLVWTLYYVAVCQAVRREPERGIAAARESLEMAESTANPTARSMARYALGLVLKKSEPDRALVLFDDAAELAAARAQLLVAGDRHDGGSGDPGGARRPGGGRRARSSPCSTTGTGPATPLSSGSTCGTWRGCCTGWAPRIRRRRAARVPGRRGQALPAGPAGLDAAPGPRAARVRARPPRSRTPGRP